MCKKASLYASSSKDWLAISAARLRQWILRSAMFLLLAREFGWDPVALASDAKMGQFTVEVDVHTRSF